MAAPNLNPGHRLNIYGSLFRLNRSFTNIINVLDEIEDIHRIFDPKRLQELQDMALEFQCEVNHALLNTLQSVEDADWHQFGKTRIARSTA